MKPLWIGIVVFICTVGGSLIGMWLRATLPAHHLRDESRDTVRLGIGLVATLTALVLGLMTASAKSSFDGLNTAIKNMAADNHRDRSTPGSLWIRDEGYPCDVEARH